MRHWVRALAVGVVLLAIVGASACGSSGESEGGDNVRRVEAGDSITVFYHGTLSNGEIFDSGRDRGEPLPFTVGSQQVIAGFDKAVIGLQVGDKVTVTLPPEEAYGQPDPELVLSVPIAEAPDGLQVGDTVSFTNGARGRVVEVTAEAVRIDANHELAGEELTFEIEVLTIE